MFSMQPIEMIKNESVIMESISDNNSSSSIVLECLTRDHIDDFYEWASDPEVTRYTIWEAYQNKQDALDFLINVAEKHPYFKAIYYQGKVVGSITLDKGKGSNSCKAELGYVLSRKSWGKGIATEAVKLVISSGFEDLDIRRIEAYVDPTNMASIRILEKSGMENEGLLKNYIVFKGNVCDRYIYSMIN